MAKADHKWRRCTNGRRLMERLHAMRRWENEPVAEEISFADLDGERMQITLDNVARLARIEPKPDPIPKGKRLKVIRLEAVRAGFKHCWRNRDYRTIIAVAQRISETILQEDPKLLMWYDQAVTRLGEE